MDWILITTEDSEMSASLTKGFLESEGISVKLGADVSGPLGAHRGKISASMLPHNVFVLEKDVEQSTKLLQERDNVPRQKTVERPIVRRFYGVLVIAAIIIIALMVIGEFA